MGREPTIREKFPPPWKARETGGGYAVTDSTGRKFVFVYGDEGLRREILNMPTRAEARTIATAIARLPELIEESEKPESAGDE